MYQYEEYDFYDLQDNPMLDPNDPDVLYAMSQCLLLGKGVEPDEEAALEYRKAAAQAGSQAAQADLAAQESSAADAALAPDYAAMDAGTLSRLAEDGDLQANLLMYDRCQRWNDPKEAEHCLRRCVDAAMTGQADLALRKEALETAGAYWRKKDDAESRRLYEMSKELGSVDACRVLLHYYIQGIGGPANPELAESCVRVLESRGTPEDVYHCAQRYLKNNGRAKAYILLERLTKAEDTPPRLAALSGLYLHELDPKAVPCQQFLAELWKCRNLSEVQDGLTRLYQAEKNLVPTGKHALSLAKAYQARKNENLFVYWLERAEQAGSAEAASQLQAVRAEKARQEAEETRRLQREKEEKARREKEARERQRQEQERRALELAKWKEEQARRQKEEEADLRRRAQRSDLQAIEVLADRLASQNPDEAKKLWDQGARLKSGVCCLRLAELACREEQSKKAMELCDKAKRYDKRLTQQANQVRAQAQKIQNAKDAQRKREEASLDFYVAKSIPPLFIQLLACAAFIALVLLRKEKVGFGSDSILFMELPSLVLGVCTLRILIRYFKIPDLQDASVGEAKARLKGPLLRQLLLPLLAGAGCVVRMGPAGLFYPYGMLFYGMCGIILFAFYGGIWGIFWSENPFSRIFHYAIGE